MNEDFFRQTVLPKVQSSFHLLRQTTTSDVSPTDELKCGITLDGLRKFFICEIEANNLNEDLMFVWLAKLGYDE